MSTANAKPSAHPSETLAAEDVPDFVPDFGQTAHSMQGESLVSVIVDCLEVDHCSKSTDMLAAYIGLSRVKTKEALLIAQPFSPALFCNGEPPGPEILLRVVDRKIRANDAQQDRY